MQTKPYSNYGLTFGCVIILFFITNLLSGKEIYKNSSLPNIVIIFADDLGYGDVSSLNPKAKTTTPAIDKLAENGLVFTEAHSSAAVCTPSRYGLLTGRYAWRKTEQINGPWGFLPPYIEPGRETLASMLKKKGYSTASIGKWHLGLGWQTKDGSGEVKIDRKTKHSNVDFSKPVSSGPNNYGFDYSFIHAGSLDMTPYLFLRDHYVVDTNMVNVTDFYPTRIDGIKDDWDAKKVSADDVYWGRGIWWRQGDMSNSFRLEDCLPTLVDEGVEYIEKQARKQESNPFFLYLSLTGPHTPWLPSEPFNGKNPMEYYGDFVADIDQVVSRVISTLKKLGMDKNTIVIFSSDNGAPWAQQDIERYRHNANQGRRGQKGDAWDGGHHIPLIISGPPEFVTKGVCKNLVSLTDLFATVAQLTGSDLSANTGEDSYPFVEVLKGNTETKIRNHMVHHSSKGMFAFRKNGWKLIDGLGSGGFTSPAFIKPKPGGPTGQLYHLQTDPKESDDVFGSNLERAKKLKEEMNLIIEKGGSR